MHKSHLDSDSHGRVKPHRGTSVKGGETPMLSQLIHCAEMIMSRLVIRANPFSGSPEGGQSFKSQTAFKLMRQAISTREIIAIT